MIGVRAASARRRGQGIAAWTLKPAVARRRRRQAGLGLRRMLMVRQGQRAAPGTRTEAPMLAASVMQAGAPRLLPQGVQRRGVAQPMGLPAPAEPGRMIQGMTAAHWREQGGRVQGQQRCMARAVMDAQAGARRRLCAWCRSSRRHALPVFWGARAPGNGMRAGPPCCTMHAALSSVAMLLM